MAAPTRYVSTFICQMRFHSNVSFLRQRIQHVYSQNRFISFKQPPVNSLTKSFHVNHGSKKRILGLTLAAGLGTVYLGDLYRRSTTVFADDNVNGPLKHRPIRYIKSDSDGTGLKLTLFQYQTCPFCCKVRAYLDYNGFSYNVVEVNSVWRSQTKWTKYKKVPILVVHGMGPDGYLQINDSSVITSSLQTFLEDPSVSLDKILEYYPSLETKNKRGKTVLEYPNKYFVMFGEKLIAQSSTEQLKEEREWRQWTDENLVHALSPNIYRTMSESRQAFQYFSEVGEWEKVFSTTERLFVIHVGAIAMYIIGKILKKRHNLHEDVRTSLYESCREWTKAVGKDRPFMGGDQPNLADLSVYGVLSAIEGCNAFRDLLSRTNIGPWYNNMKKTIQSHAGHRVEEHVNIVQNATNFN